MMHYCGALSFAAVFFLGMAPRLIFGSDAGYFGGQEINYERLNYEQESSTLCKLSSYIAKDEERHLKSSFRRLDRILGRLLIRHKASVEETEYSYTNLRKFLSGPHSFPKILAILSEQPKEIPPEHLEKIMQMKRPSLFKALKYLDEVNVLPFVQGNELFLKHAPLTPSEVIRLLENGIVQAKSSIIVELKTGSFYGQSLEMDDIVFRALKVLSLEHDPVELSSSESLFHSGLRTKVRKLLFELYPDVANDDEAKEFISDAHVINLIRTYFMTYAVTPTYFWYRQPNINNRPPMVNNVNNTAFAFMPGSLSVMIIGNHYFKNINASMYHYLNVDPVGMFYSGSVSMLGGGPSWWVRYTDGYLGAGFNYSFNVNNAFWSTGQSSFLTVGGNVSGWRDNISFGINAATSVSSSTFVGAYVQATLNRTHEVSYLGEYPIDGKVKEIRGLHQIQINDLMGAQLTGAAQVNFSALYAPVTVAFRASSSLTKSRLYRTHRRLKDTQSMLKERGKAGILYLLGKKIRYSQLPRFENPESLKVGDELSETKIGKLMGGFMVGIESMSAPVHAFRLTVNLEITAEFELGIKRWPNNKYEVEIEMKKIVELSAYQSAANIFGLGQSLGAALAKKQIYLFDFNQPAARIAYFKLVNEGKLPQGMDIELYNKGRSAEYLITHFRAQNHLLDTIGVQRIHLEKITIDSAKVFGGINAPIVPSMVFIVNELDKHLRKSKKRLNLVYEPIDVGLMQSDSETIITNGLVSVVMNTHGGRFSQGQGFSGRYDEDLFVTHERIHTIDFIGQNKWKFHSLNVTASFQDSVITGRQENDIVKRINRLFNLGIPKFAIRNSKTPRIVELARSITPEELLILDNPETYARINIASYYSQLSYSTVKQLLDAIRGEHFDLQGQYIQEFLKKYNLPAFSALHMLLGGKPEDIRLSSSAGYEDVITEAKMFVIDYSNINENEKKLVSFSSKDRRKNRHIVKRFYRGARGHLREIDGALRRLYHDVFLVDSKDKDEDIRKITLNMLEKDSRQDKQPIFEELLLARENILQMLDLKEQGFSLRQRIKIYSYAQKKNRRFNELVEDYLALWPENIDETTKKKEIKDRINHCCPMIRKIAFRLRLHEEDEVSKNISEAHYAEEGKELKKLLESLERIVTLERLSPQKQEYYRQKFGIEQPRLCPR